MECLAAASAGQTTRDAHHLVDARERFRVCAQRQCPAVVQEDCGRWLAEVERSLPTVVLTARDGAAGVLSDVVVTEEGRAIASKLDGIAIPIDPGAHTFRFATTNGLSIEVKAIVVEGEQHQTVSAVLQPKGAVPLSDTKPPPPGQSELAASNAPPFAHGSPWPTVAFISLGVGAAGLALGGIFGGITFADRASAHCDAAGFCDAVPLHNARTAATISTSTLAVGGALAAAGGALLVWGPKGGTTLAVTPTVGRGETGIVFTEVW